MTTAWKRRFGLLLFLLALAGFLYGASVALTPCENTPGMKWRAYKSEPRNTIDAFFVGSSYAFCDVIPAKIYEESGITSYVIGAPSMPPRLMEYYLREAYRTQTPQAFERKRLISAIEKSGLEGTDEASVWLAAGEPLLCVDGEERNFKVTTQFDWEMARALTERNIEKRTGHGYDIHQLVEGRPLIIAGIRSRGRKSACWGTPTPTL